MALDVGIAKAMDLEEKGMLGCQAKRLVGFSVVTCGSIRQYG